MVFPLELLNSQLDMFLLFIFFKKLFIFFSFPIKI